MPPPRHDAGEAERTLSARSQPETSEREIDDDEALGRLERAKEVCIAKLRKRDALSPARGTPGSDAAVPPVFVPDHADPELAAIEVQRAVVLQRLGRLDEASEAYTAVLRAQSKRNEGPVDLAVLDVACSNLMSLLRLGGRWPNLAAMAQQPLPKPQPPTWPPASRAELRAKTGAEAPEKWEEAVEAAETAQAAEGPEEVGMLCRLVWTLAAVDPLAAEECVLRLSTLVPDHSHLDAAELAAAPVSAVVAPPRPRRGGAEEKKEGTQETEAKRQPETRRRKRKPRYPKGFDLQNPGPPPDPERWLPKHERADFKRRLRKRDRALMRGPQGAMGADDQAFRTNFPTTAQVELPKEAVKPPKARRAKAKK